MEDNRNSLYIPTQIERRLIIIPGIGLKNEGIVLLTVSLIAIAFSYCFLNLYHGCTVVAVIFGITLMSIRKDNTNRSITDVILQIIKFNKSQKEYKFFWFNKFINQ